MAYIIPESTVSLYSGIPITNGNQVVFKTRAEQTAYFTSKRTALKADCSYIRKTGRLRIEYSAAAVLAADYISFKNVSFENITFYAEIVDFEYVNNVTTDIIYAIDWFQTFMFDVTYHASSILREHLTKSQHDLAVANPWRRDIPELMTDEGLPVGESLETIYTQGNVAFLSSDANRFSLIPNATIFPSAEVIDDTPYVVFVLSQFDWGQWELTDAIEFRNLWDFYGGTHTSVPTTFPEFFSTWKDGFVRATALVGLTSDAPQAMLIKLNRAIELLTLYNCTSSMAGLYVMPKWTLSGYFADSGSTDFSSGFEYSFEVSLLNHNPKLNTFPFRYLRVKTPKDIKEYRLDLFNTLSANDTPGNIYYKILSNFNGLPTLSFSPKNYKYDSGDYNYYERIDFSDFPQVAYSTDAYLTYLSGQYASAISNNTISGQYNINAMQSGGLAGMIGSLGSAIKSGIGGVTGTEMQWAKTKGASGLNYTGTTIGTTDSSGMSGMSGGAAGAFGGFLASGGALNSANQQRNTFNEATSSRTGDSAVYDGTKRAFVNDHYNAGGSSGYLPYQYGTLDFVAEIVTLADDILDKYDDYFTCNGYKSLRNGVPHVCNYINNGAEIPHFNTFDGDTFTYVQTENMKVTGAIQAACNAIENLFNSGCRFLKVT